jgi:hypothetical protein
MITLEEFINTTYHTETLLIVPTLNRLKIDKFQFKDENGKYSIQRQNEYLEILYYDTYGKKYTL